MVRSPFLAKAGMVLEMVVELSEYEMASSVPMNAATSSSICSLAPYRAVPGSYRVVSVGVGVYVCIGRACARRKKTRKISGGAGGEEGGSGSSNRCSRGNEFVRGYSHAFVESLQYSTTDER